MQLLKIEKEKAEKRRKIGGHLPPTLAEGQGEAIEIVAKKIGLKKESFRKVTKIIEFSVDYPEIFDEWKQALEGKKAFPRFMASQSKKRGYTN